MARIKLDLPETFPFETRIRLRRTDMNHGGHLGNDQLLTLIGEARMRFYESLGYTELDVEGAGTIMADAAIAYRAEAFPEDELVFQVAAGDFSRTGCDLIYRITRASDGVEVAHAKTGIRFMDYAARKVLPVPEGFRRKCG